MKSHSLQLKKKRRGGFSLMEVMSAIVIIAVVATASLSGLSAMRGKANAKMDQTNIAELNSKVQAYHLEYGKWPDTRLRALHTGGYVDTARQTTPFGGFYTFDNKTKTVVNTYAPK